MIVAEKPSVAMSYAKVLGATSRKDGYLEGNGYLVSWCVGHLVELAPPNILKKIVLFPVSLFVAFLALMAKWLLTLSSYVVAPLMLYIFGCGIYTAYRQTWDQFFILLVAEFICFVLFFGATAITEDIGRFSEWLAEL